MSAVRLPVHLPTTCFYCGGDLPPSFITIDGHPAHYICHATAEADELERALRKAADDSEWPPIG